jgi:poly-gamma-glutamate synthesis protein (capsule biosynthesis protein)
MKVPLALLSLTLVLILSVVAALQAKASAATFAFAGDVMLGRGVAQVNQGSSWDSIFGTITPQIQRADLAFANLESPLTSAPLLRETNDLRAPKEASRALAVAGIDVVSLANNHALDAGQEGLLDTLTALSDFDVRSIGPQPEPWVVQVKNLKLAWFALDDTLNPLDLDELRHTFATLDVSVDLIITSIHWGNELDPAPNDRQRYLAAGLAAAGADLIIGHHPHVLQPISWIWGTGRGRPTFVAFSLGNAIFDQAAPPSVRIGALLGVEIGRSGLSYVCVFPFRTNPQNWHIAAADPNSIERISRDVRLGCTQPPISPLEEK